MATATTPCSSPDLTRTLAATLYSVHGDDFRGSVLPIRRMTRKDIEHQLDQAFAVVEEAQQHHGRSIAASTPPDPIANHDHHILTTCSIEPLFPQRQPADGTNHYAPPPPSLPPLRPTLSNRDLLKLTSYRPLPLYSNETPLAPPGLLSIALDTNAYAAKRRRMNLDMETIQQEQDSASDSQLVNPMDIEFDGERQHQPHTISDSGAAASALQPAVRIAASPTLLPGQQLQQQQLQQQQSTTTITTTITKPSLQPVPIRRIKLFAKPPAPTEAAAAATTTSSRYAIPVSLRSPPENQPDAYPKGWVPIYPTPFQQLKCDELKQAAEQDASNYKPLFLDTIGSLNHPLVAMVDDYGSTAPNKWEGSGKTHFLRDFIIGLRESGKALKVAIISFDINNEGFLFDEIRGDLGLPCMRLGSVLDENWEREYGVLLMTSPDIADDFRQPTADIIIAFDIRIRPRHNAFQKIRKRNVANRAPPTVWLVTLGSIEDRAARYALTDVAHANYWANNWWSTDPEYQKLLLAENTWPDQEERDQMASLVLESVMLWVKDGFVSQYQFGKPSLSHPRISVSPAPVSTPSSAESTPTPVPVEVEQPQQQQQQQDVAANVTPRGSDDACPIFPTITIAPTDQDVQEQVKQIFRYSPLFAPRELNLSARDEDDDESASFHSASEFIDTESPSLNLRLAHLKTEYHNQCQAIRIRIRQQYVAEMEALKRSYEQKALEEMKDTQL